MRNGAVSTTVIGILAMHSYYTQFAYSIQEGAIPCHRRLAIPAARNSIECAGAYRSRIAARGRGARIRRPARAHDLAAHGVLPPGGAGAVPNGVIPRANGIEPEGASSGQFSWGQVFANTSNWSRQDARKRATNSRRCHSVVTRRLLNKCKITRRRRAPR